MVNVVGGFETGRRPFKKGKNKKKKKVQSTGSGLAKKKNKTDMSKVECFHCKKQGHWKRNCSLYIATLDPNRPNKKKKQQAVAATGIYMMNPCNFSQCDISNWVLDTGSPTHICNSLQGLQVRQRFKNGERFLNVGDGSSVPVLALGVVELCLETFSVVLSDCHYCPSFLLNVISVGQLATEGYEFSIKNDILNIIMNGVLIMQGQLKNGIYTLLRPVSVVYTSGKRSREDNVNDIYLWHCRLGHINKNRITRLVKEGLLDLSDCESLPTCESCLLGKMTKSPFTGKGERARELLGLVHTDVCGPMNVSAKGGYSYFIPFTDDLSRYGYVFLLRHKSESIEMFNRYRNEIKKQTGKSIKILRCDRGGEYLYSEFLTYLGENRILSLWNRTLLDMVRSMMSFATPPESF